MSNVSSEPSLGTRFKVWLQSIPFVTRSVMVGCSGVYIFQLLTGLYGSGRTCLNAQYVVHNLQVYRILSSPFCHVGLLHIFFNMFAYIPMGGNLERHMGSVMFASVNLLVILLSAFIYIIIAYLLLFTTIYPEAILSCHEGYSGVLFALIVVSTGVSGASHYSIFGFFDVPAQYYAWALLFFWQLLLPGVSFLGHLTGILVGQMYTWGWLNRLMPSSGTISWMEQSRIMGSCNNQPSFILSSAAGPSIPTHHEAPGGGGFSGMLRGLQGWTRVDSQAQPFQGQARTIEGESQSPSLPWAGASTTAGANVPSTPADKHSLPSQGGEENPSIFTGKPNFIGGTPQSDAGPSVPIQNPGAQERLLEMGFDPESIKHALQASGGDVNGAIEILSRN